jgi:adenylyltransferase/sulfurtransferase
VTHLIFLNLDRYQRQIIVPNHGIEGQQALAKAKVLVVGAGGLGSPICVYLNACGVGNVGIIDGDTVSKSNLHRQVWYKEDDIGKSKTDTLIAFLKAQNSNTKLSAFNHMLDTSNAHHIFSGFDIIVDGSDNFETRYLVNDVCVELNKPLVFGAIYQYEGQVAVFNVRDEEGDKGPNYRDLFPNPSDITNAPNCNEAGVIGVLPGIVGNMQAMEVVKLITGHSKSTIGKLITIDTLSMEVNKFKIRKVFDNSKIDSKSTDYKLECSVHDQTIKTIDTKTLQSWIKNKLDFQLIDVREANEYLVFNIGGELMPLSNFKEHASNICQDKPIVILCQSGQRSLNAIQLLKETSGNEDIYNLEGGLNSWTK